MPRRSPNTDGSETARMGKHPELARYTQELLGYPHNVISVREAGSRADISYATIANMARGDRPEMESLIKFGLAMKGNVNTLLEFAGYTPIRLEPDEMARAGLIPDGWTLTAGKATPEELALKQAIENEVARVPEDEEIRDELRNSLYRHLKSYLPLALAAVEKNIEPPH